MAALLIVLTAFTSVNSQTASGCTDSYHCANTEITQSEVECSGYYSCAETTIKQLTTTSIHCTASSACNLAKTLTANQNIACGGHKSCYGTDYISSNTIQCGGTSSCSCDKQSPQNTLISAESLLYCGGQQSCQFSTLSADKNTYCQGLNSCADATINGDTVFCDGNAACTRANIRTETSAVCTGKSACAAANINALHTQFYGEDSGKEAIINSQLIEAFGFRSLVQATIDSDGQSSMTIKMFAEMSGDGATVLCQSGSVCQLFCKNTGCKGLTYQCLKGSECDISPDGCLSDNSVDIYKGINCPTRIYTNHMPETPEMFAEESVETALDTVTASIQCNVERECEGRNQFGDVIECSGLNSCDAASISTNGVSETENIFCYGEQACNAGILSSDTGSVSCFGADSCMSANIDAKTVKCNGMNSCLKTFGAIDNIECTATEACQSTFIHSTAISIPTDCTGCRACKESNIFAESSILCSGHYSCMSSEMISNKHIVCSGMGSCASAAIDAMERVYAIGHLSAAFTKISTQWVRAYGYHSLLFATVDSKDKSEILIHAFGHQSGYGSTVICREDSKCTLVCRGSACKNLDYLCMNDAVCILQPIKCRGKGTEVFAGVECPNMEMEVSPDRLEQFKKRKVYQMNSDEVYKRYNKEIQNDDKQFEALGEISEELDSVDDDLETFDEDSGNVDENLDDFGENLENNQLFNANNRFGTPLSIEISAFVVIVLVIIALGVCICYNRIKKGHYVYEQIP